ncbi:MAG: hypothetical protein ACON5A_01120 [Candidatus Comchoanobacterales bacterium]
MAKTNAELIQNRILDPLPKRKHAIDTHTSWLSSLLMILGTVSLIYVFLVILKFFQPWLWPANVVHSININSFFSLGSLPFDLIQLKWEHFFLHIEHTLPIWHFILAAATIYIAYNIMRYYVDYLYVYYFPSKSPYRDYIRQFFSLYSTTICLAFIPYLENLSILQCIMSFPVLSTVVFAPPILIVCFMATNSKSHINLDHSANQNDHLKSESLINKQENETVSNENPKSTIANSKEKTVDTPNPKMDDSEVSNERPKNTKTNLKEVTTDVSSSEQEYSEESDDEKWVDAQPYPSGTLMRNPNQ